MEGELNYIQFYNCQLYISLLIPPGLTADGLPVEPVLVHTALDRVPGFPPSIRQNEEADEELEAFESLKKTETRTKINTSAGKTEK